MSEDDGEAIVKEIRAKRGYLYPWQEYMARHDPDFIAKYERLWEMIGARTVTLPQKFKQLMIVAVLVSRLDDVSMRTQMRRARRLGATPEEILETIQAAYLPSGAPSLVHGVQALIDILAEEEEASAGG